MGTPEGSSQRSQRGHNGHDGTGDASRSVSCSACPGIAAYAALFQGPDVDPETFHCIDGGFGSVILSGPVVSFVNSVVPVVMNQHSLEHAHQLKRRWL